MMLFQDPPRHARLRRLIGCAFTLSVIQNLRPFIQQTVDGLLDRMQHAGTIDLIAEFAFPLSVHVIAELLGVPATDRDLFHRWSLGLARGLEEHSVPPFFSLPST